MNLHLFAGLYNFMIIPFWLFSKIEICEPCLFSAFGVMAILLWGSAYIAVSKNRYVSTLNFIFFLEKISYVFMWALWLLNNDFIGMVREDFFTGAFMISYGIGDILFGLYFLTMFVTSEDI